MKKKRQAASKQAAKKTTLSSPTTSLKSSRKLSKNEAVKQGKATTNKQTATESKRHNRTVEENKHKAKYVSSKEQPSKATEEYRDGSYKPHTPKQALLIANQDQLTRSEHKRSQSSLEKLTVFEGFCEDSTYLKRNHRAASKDDVISIALPEGLPNKLLVRALQQHPEPYEVLVPQYIQGDDELPQSIEVLLESIPVDKLAKLVQEMDTLISQFTARS